MRPTKTSRLLAYIKRRRIVRTRDVLAAGWLAPELARLKARGLVNQIGRGLYTIADVPLSERTSIAEVSKRVPQAIICLLSALQFHGITTQLPFEVWITVDVKARKPNIDFPPVRVVRSSGKSLNAGAQVHKIEGVSVRVYSPAKTVVDCFKYRNKIGIDVAIEALRECREKRLATVDELWRFAQICRVRTVMRPYLEAIV